MRGKVMLQFVLLALAWGASFLFIKVALDGLSPAQVVLGRLVAGAAALVVIAAVTRQSLPRDPVVWLHLAVVAILLCVVPFLLFAWAGQHVDSGLASIYNATTPLMTMIVALAVLPDERLTRTSLVGLAVGFAGVVVVLAPWRGATGSSIAAQTACLLATFCYGVAFVYVRRFVSPLRLPAVAVTTVQVGIGALIMLLAAPFIATAPAHLSWPVVLSVTALGVVGTGLAYVWNTNVVADWGATKASTVTYLTPIVGVSLGVAVLGERLSWSEPVGALIVLVGMALLQNRAKTSVSASGIAQVHVSQPTVPPSRSGSG
ncbi:Permease of the drug/metabolite transporter (DMT) superfamily [Lentzea albidocapillata subsp. violacea]|uniref:Permease of the drug/metabolite transporter (DMT) superfamily n=1 Tax=Lentzea albidocapillata subsp. violacea TaxID=128104 RepID=A0A1G9MPG0_9PSEU|nr:DMT family transporter [Lentzea albidocapillata]SDL75994.1 Permease of the drug/metabolite transporter (DMT) superfamily [Lentzea albidocapillata subsp. violacea]